MALYVISSRNIHASPHRTSIYVLEDMLEAACDARLIAPVARNVTSFLDKRNLNLPLNKFSSKLISKSIGLYKSLDDIPKSSSDEAEILFLIGMDGADLELLSCLKEWREKFDLVISLIYDAWLINAFPRFTAQIDHLFVPIVDLIAPLKQQFSIPVSYWPHAANVLEQGSCNLERSIDIASYGRIPTEYHTRLFELSTKASSDLFYYRQIPETAQLYPEEPYTSRRFDYQHRGLLNKVLAHSKISLAFDFTYTIKGAIALPNYQEHPSYIYRKPVLALRWFEGLAAGATIVGKRPPTPEVDQLLDWEDATIELPDDVESGIDIILALLQDKDRLREIHHRNYWHTLKRHDHRWRIKAAFEQLNLPIPPGLKTQLAQIEKMCSQAEAVM
ncbi:MAG: glycosyltransferase [Cyanobacteria bacterium J06639_14]